MLQVLVNFVSVSCLHCWKGTSSHNFISVYGSSNLLLFIVGIQVPGSHRLLPEPEICDARQVGCKKARVEPDSPAGGMRCSISIHQMQRMLFVVQAVECILSDFYRAVSYTFNLQVKTMYLFDLPPLDPHCFILVIGYQDFFP